MTKSVLVTGASGYLGGKLVARLLAAGREVTALGLTREVSPFPEAVRYARLDLSDGPAAARFFAEAPWDAIVHLAGPVPKAYPDWSHGAEIVGAHTTIAANLRMALLPTFRGRLVHTSSMTVYGPPSTARVSEDHPRRPMHPYGMAKVIAEDVMFAGPPIDRWVLRFGGLFSEERRGGALFHFMKAAREGRPLAVDCGQATPWTILHVDDAVTGILRAIDAPAADPGAINLAYGEPIEIVAVAEKIAARTGVAIEKRGDAAHPPLDLAIDKARGLFEWPPHTLQERLDELWDRWA